MRNAQVADPVQRHQYVLQLARDFQLVMLTEYFDESLVLLRRLLCWGVKDVLYIPKNKNSFKQQRDFTSEDVSIHRKLNVADYELYDFFLARLQRQMAAQGEDLVSEVAAFKQTLERVQAYCAMAGAPGSRMGSLRFPESYWSQAFLVSADDCRMMQKHELIFLDELMVDAIRRYQKSVSRTAALQQAGGSHASRPHQSMSARTLMQKHGVNEHL
jgi:hypothetical protein